MLLDTHAILWLLSGDSRLSEEARRYYEREERVLYSLVSLWEIGIKLGLQREDFQLANNWWREIPRELAAQGVTRLDIAAEDCREVGNLPLHHRDPFDRMLVVQALREQCPILSADEKLDAYRIRRLW